MASDYGLARDLGLGGNPPANIAGGNVPSATLNTTPATNLDASTTGGAIGSQNPTPITSGNMIGDGAGLGNPALAQALSQMDPQAFLIGLLLSETEALQGDLIVQELSNVCRRCGFLSCRCAQQCTRCN